MSLIVLTGPARSGKSTAAEQLATSRGLPVAIAVAGRAEDPEMRRRIEGHQRARSTDIAVIEACTDLAWLDEVPEGCVLIVECLGTLVGAIVAEEVAGEYLASGGEEDRVRQRVDGLITAILARSGDTVVVTNETAWGVVPAYASGRVFRDALGRANKELVDRADAAYLAVTGRYIDLKAAPPAPSWPAEECT